ncbi:hypothetical protein Pmar_PMAR027774 [Perkinsus marinus ATCC 50983]|uniref:Uncharacterized protein n=1 Tax=Perkinsus marinus (strain ATCC 50983 / TXsc) TaxID=423536 RepID=C5LS68_PERM5|nr:hypothetical protein Pmar_PMAR027774 [Perkinsus marinus ATCC 50983]EER00430.1 hypothetical protein Pmar_PMAR027774 [Perkinsus marinus ATCC 50983]|eukprot:XP_002767712.1 hypothetical protein Pmar_PMAR027774 [Perkinsus marinus ATCC 50983]
MFTRSRRPEETTAQTTDAQKQSFENYDLEAMPLVPMTGRPLKIAGSMVTGDNIFKRNVRKIVSGKTFKDIGVS